MTVRALAAGTVLPVTGDVAQCVTPHGSFVWTGVTVVTVWTVSLCLNDFPSLLIVNFRFNDDELSILFCQGKRDAMLIVIKHVIHTAYQCTRSND